MEFCTIASGSSGNCTLVSEGNTHILIDAGISMRRTVSAIRSFGVEPDMLSGIFVTHEHSDHISGLEVLSRRYDIPVFASKMTADALLSRGLCAGSRLRPFPAGIAFDLGDILIHSFRTPHDTPESVGYKLSAGGASLAFATDLGFIPDSVLEAVSGADAVILEANHDVDMLMSGNYPYYLKKRILGNGGHLSNETAAKCAVHLVKAGVSRIVLAHLSLENNRPDLALGAVSAALREAGAECLLSAAPRETPGTRFSLHKGKHLC